MPTAQLGRVESHLASCRDCRALVAALAGDEGDSNAATHRHEKVSEDSQVSKRPVLSIGDRVGRYLVLATLGSGGMGVVFTAYDPQLDRKVALKLLRGNLGVNAKEARTRLKREAQAIAQLNHPNVVGVYDVGTTDDGDVYIAMEFVEGDTLTTWLKNWPRTWREIIDVFQQAGRGLMAAHGVGLLHRDFKPDNVLVGSDGRVRVTDFGLARSVMLDDSARGAITTSSDPRATTDPGAKRPAPASPLGADLTATGTVLGTPRYMPPEQLTGPTIDARADQFSFCVALYEALYGTHPLKGSTSVAMLEHGEKALPLPEKTQVPAAIGRVVMRGLEKERQKRFPTMAALMQELTPPPQRSPMKFIALSAVGALLVTGGVAWYMTKDSQPILVAANDDRAVEVLYKEIQRKDEELKILRQELNKQIENGKVLEKLKEQLDVKTIELNNLTQELIKEKAKRVPNAAGKPIVAQITSEQVTTAIQAERDSIQFCLDDIDSRVLSTEGAPKSRDIDVVVKLSTSPMGEGSGFLIGGIDYSPSTKLCIEHALKRVAYPKGTDSLDIRITIAWSAGILNMVANVVGQRAPGGSTLLDL